uniref:B30.2/SPRY domain-containing protein n=1 Tax=Globodera rostochiensis TaxID=31243 RepID=A0A914HXI5_GLORO
MGSVQLEDLQLLQKHYLSNQSRQQHNNSSSTTSSDNSSFELFDDGHSENAEKISNEKKEAMLNDDDNEMSTKMAKHLHSMNDEVVVDQPAHQQQRNNSSSTTTSSSACFEVVDGEQTENAENARDEKVAAAGREAMGDDNGTATKMAKDSHSVVWYKVAQRAIDELFLIQPKNRWNVNDCHTKLFVVQPDGATVQRHEKHLCPASVRAEMMIPRHSSGIFYFEVNIVKLSNWCCVGFAPASMPLDTEFVGFVTNSYSYKSDGTFWGHNVFGCGYFWDAPNIIAEKGTFTAGDVVGCGVNLATRQIIYTLNGQRLDTDNLLVYTTDLYPCISLMAPGDTLEANFGPNFCYELGEEYAPHDVGTENDEKSEQNDGDGHSNLDDVDTANDEKLEQNDRDDGHNFEQLEQQEEPFLFLVCPKNRWNTFGCPSDLFVIQPDCHTVYRRGNESRYSVCSVRAESMMPRHHCGIFYYEVTILEMGAKIHVGLAPKSMPLGLNECVGSQQNAYSFDSDGTFWGHNVRGCKFSKDGTLAGPYVTEKGTFTAGDVVGCGVNLATRQIIYTLNGQKLQTTNLRVHQSDLYPFVSLMDCADTVMANFGPRFKYNLEEELQ